MRWTVGRVLNDIRRRCIPLLSKVSWLRTPHTLMTSCPHILTSSHPQNPTTSKPKKQKGAPASARLSGLRGPGKNSWRDVLPESSTTLFLSLGTQGLDLVRSALENDEKLLRQPVRFVIKFGYSRRTRRKGHLSLRAYCRLDRPAVDAPITTARRRGDAVSKR